MTHRSTDPAMDPLIAEMLRHVPFDGWSQKALDASARAIGMAPETLHRLCPRGAVDVAVAHHIAGDAAMTRRMAGTTLAGMRYREQVALALRTRLDVLTDREVVRSAGALFSLPTHAGDGARLIWGTADAIWLALGDTSDDINWYTKRAILSGVWASTLLYWLGDETPDTTATTAFVDRRIAEVMQFEKFKGQVNDATLLKPLTVPLNRLLKLVKAPARVPPADMPGSWTAPR